MAPYVSDKQRRFMHSQKPEIAARWDKEMKGKKKKAKLSVNNKLKGALGQMDTKTNKIEINVKKHRGDKAELASTIAHELAHVKHPKMTEKQVYKKTAKTKIPPQEQSKLIAKLRMAKINRRIGMTKHKMKMKREDSVGPGDLINKARELSPKTRIAIMGM